MKNIGFFCKVPRGFLGSKSGYEIMVFTCLEFSKLLRNDRVAVTSIGAICEGCNYKNVKGKSGFPYRIKAILEDFINIGYINSVNKKFPTSFEYNEYSEFELSEIFFLKDDFIKLTTNEFNTLMHIKSSAAKPLLLKCYLYVKSFIFEYQEYEIGKVSAFYQAIDEMVANLHISRKKVDKCLDLFVQNGLLCKHETGSYKTHMGTIKNAPNIYVLNNENAKENINTAVKRLKYNLEVEKFIPITYCGKKLRKDDNNE